LQPREAPGPGKANTWFIEVMGTRGGVNFSTQAPEKTARSKAGKVSIWAINRRLRR